MMTHGVTLLVCVSAEVCTSVPTASAAPGCSKRLPPLGQLIFSFPASVTPGTSYALPVLLSVLPPWLKLENS